MGKSLWQGKLDILDFTPEKQRPEKPQDTRTQPTQPDNTDLKQEKNDVQYHTKQGFSD